MAIYHCSIKIISRGQGRSAVAAAAYRSGTKLHCDREDREYNFSRKSGVIVQGIFLPKNAPKEYKDRETLWNSVEKIEKNSCAQLAREFEVALPAELDVKHQKTVIREFCVYLRDQGMICDAAIHDKGDGNPHAHIMTTMRSLLPDGSWAPKSKLVYDLDAAGNRIYMRTDKRGCKIYKNHKENYNDWNNPKNAEVWRAKWAEICNRYLSKEQQIDHRSYARQGIDQIPTIHEGYAARQMERCGQPADRCQINRDIKAAYAKTQEIADQKAGIDKLLKQLTVLHKQQEQAAVVAAPTLEPREVDYAPLYAAERTMKQAADRRDRATKALKDLQGIQHEPINDFGLQKDVDRWRMAVRMIEIMRKYRNVYDEYAGKKFGKKGYYKKHEQQIQSYTQAQQWMANNGVYLDYDTTLNRLTKAEEKLQEHLAAVKAKRDFEVANAQKTADQADAAYRTAETRFKNLMADYGIDLRGYGYEDFGGPTLGELVREKASPSMAAVDRPQQSTENPKVSASDQAVKEAILDEFAEVMTIDWGKASEEYQTFEAPGLFEDIPVPESFADRLQRAQREAADRNRSREKSSHHHDHDFER